MSTREPRTLFLLAKEVLLYLPSIGAPALVGVVGLVVLTRLLSPASYGHYALAFAVATMAAAVLGDWLTPTLIRFAAEEPASRSSDVIRSCFGMAIASGLIAAVVVSAALGGLLPYVLTLSAAAMAVALPFYKVGLAALRANVMTRKYSMLSVGVSILAFAAGLAWYMATDAVSALLWGPAVVYVFALWPVVRWMGLTTRDFRGGIDRSRARTLLSFGAPIIVTAIGSQALLLADRYLLAALSGASAVGLYVPNYAIAERSMGFAFTPLFSAFYPLATRAWARGDRQETAKLLTMTHRLFLVVGGYVALVLVLMSEEIARLLLDAEFARAHHVIGIVAVGNLVWFQGILFHQPLELDKQTRVITVQALGAGALNIALNVLFIPRFGLEGAAWATVISYCVYTAVAFVWTRRRVEITVDLPLATFGRVLGFAVLALAYSTFVPSPDVASVFGMLGLTVLYAVWLIGTREPIIKEFMTFARARSG